MVAVSYQLFINDTPAESQLVDAIQNIEVEDNIDLADMIRLRISIAVKDGCSEWSVIDENIFDRLTKLEITVAVGSGPPEHLMQAYVIETDAGFANQPGQSVLNVVAMDPTVLMNLQPNSKPWPNMSDSDIATAIFTNSDYGFTPVVDSTSPQWSDQDVTQQQRLTDIQYLRKLAKRNGFECYVETNPLTGIVEGHFHAPHLQDPAQALISVNLGESTNVNSFKARYDMLRPATARATSLDIDSQSNQDVQSTGGSLTQLGKSSSVPTDQPRQVLLARTGLFDGGDLQRMTQAFVDQSALAIVADGDLNTSVFGKILRAKRPVEVRGAGVQFSGTYYVQKVLHTLAGDSYTQAFTLRRNGTGLIGNENFSDPGAAA